jgi:hypothetical protein
MNTNLIKKKSKVTVFFNNIKDDLFIILVRIPDIRSSAKIGQLFGLSNPISVQKDSNIDITLIVPISFQSLDFLKSLISGFFPVTLLNLIAQSVISTIFEKFIILNMIKNINKNPIK